MTGKSKRGKRTDTLRLGKFTCPEEERPARGVYHDDLLVVMDDGKFYQVKRPACPDCESGNVRYDRLGDHICKRCGMVVSSGPKLVRDKMGAGVNRKNK